MLSQIASSTKKLVSFFAAEEVTINHSKRGGSDNKRGGSDNYY